MLDTFKQKSEKQKEHFKDDLKSIRTGRANPAIIEDVSIESYGAKTPLKHLANISVADSKTLVIEPWDKNLTKEIEKGLINSNIGLTPNVDGALIRIKLPEQTEENRKNLVKLLGEKLEDNKVAVRRHREEAKKQIESAQKNGDITEDDKKKFIDDLDKTTKNYIDEMDKDAEEKEKEIMTV